MNVTDDVDTPPGVRDQSLRTRRMRRSVRRRATARDSSASGPGPTDGRDGLRDQTGVTVRTARPSGEPPVLKLRSWWRIPVVALFAGFLAFLGSFVIPASYESSTRVLVRGRDATILSSTGTNLGSQPGIVDSTLGTALTSTQIAVLGSHDVAERIVTRLKLDQRPEETGAIHNVKAVVAGFIKRGRAYVSHGMYREPTKREQALEDVATGLRASAVGDSFVVEISAVGSTPEDARNIANTAAAVLVEMSSTRSSKEAEANRAAIQTQLDRALAGQAAAEQAVAEYKRANNITSLESSLVLSASSLQELRSQLNSTEAELSSVKARLAETKAQLARTAPTTNSKTAIQTGRSSTEVSNSVTNSNYTELLSTSQRLTAEIAGLTAKSASLKKFLAAKPEASASLPETEAGLGVLTLNQELAKDVVRGLSSEYELAVSRTQRGSVELTRLDKAALPLYPVAPARWMYLMLGLVLGGLFAFVATYRSLRRNGAFAPPAVLEHDWYYTSVLPPRFTFEERSSKLAASDSSGDPIDLTVGDPPS